jgi:hypothetical protein
VDSTVVRKVDETGFFERINAEYSAR